MADENLGMDVDEEEVELPSSSNAKGERKRFEVKKVIVQWFDDCLHEIIASCFFISGMQLRYGPGVRSCTFCIFFLTDIN